METVIWLLPKYLWKSKFSEKLHRLQVSSKLIHSYLSRISTTVFRTTLFQSTFFSKYFLADIFEAVYIKSLQNKLSYLHLLNKVISEGKIIDYVEHLITEYILQRKTSRLKTINLPFQIHSSISCLSPISNNFFHSPQLYQFSEGPASHLNNRRHSHYARYDLHLNYYPYNQPAD